MRLRDHVTTFAGRPVENFDLDVGIEDPTEVVYRLRLAWDGDNEHASLLDLIAEFLDDPRVSQVPALVIGQWETANAQPTSAGVIAALAAASERLLHLRGVFIGDIISEENEISWIKQDNVRPVLDAYPALELLQIRGGGGLSLDGPFSHAALRSLIIESGGLGAEVVRDVAAADLPNLEHLELWLGADEYGGDATVADLASILDGTRFPKVEYLGLRDAEIADDIAAALATAPIVSRIKVLDLSLGNLSDKGAAALLQNPAITKLQKLDLHHHYLSDEMMARLQGLGIEVDLSGRQEADEDWDDEDNEIAIRYIAVSE